MFTHFGSADGRDAQSEMRTRIQGERFINCLDGLDKIGFERGVAHCCNSRALFRYPQYRLDAVRVGAALYGIGGSDRALKPVLSMRAPLLQVRFADKGEYIGYGLRKLERPAKLGIVGAGYGHGISRRLSDKGQRFGERAEMSCRGQDMYGFSYGRPDRHGRPKRGTTYG